MNTSQNEENQKPEQPVCVAKDAAGKRCPKPALPNSNYCAEHTKRSGGGGGGGGWRGKVYK